MEFAVNYSPAAAALWRAGRIQVDRWKCPAWPDLIAEARQSRPVYVHLPLSVGQGQTTNTETGMRANWEQIEALLAETDTPQINVHMTPERGDWSETDAGSATSDQVERVTERLIADLTALTARFGARRVVAENPGMQRATALRPETIGRAIEETGCGFLLDLAHARLAALRLKMDAREYVRALPTERICEIHVTGVQRYSAPFWTGRSRHAGVDEAQVRQYAGWHMDHMPMADDDWPFVAWAMGCVHSGSWSTPWIVSLECGGVGPWFDALTDAESLAQDIPRLRALVKKGPAG